MTFATSRAGEEHSRSGQPELARSQARTASTNSSGGLYPWATTK
jgi:hypothetical protein